MFWKHFSPLWTSQKFDGLIKGFSNFDTLIDILLMLDACACMKTTMILDDDLIFFNQTLSSSQTLFQYHLSFQFKASFFLNIFSLKASSHLFKHLWFIFFNLSHIHWKSIKIEKMFMVIWSKMINLPDHNLLFFFFSNKFFNWNFSRIFSHIFSSASSISHQISNRLLINFLLCSFISSGFLYHTSITMWTGFYNENHSTITDLGSKSYLYKRLCFEGCWYEKSKVRLRNFWNLISVLFVQRIFSIRKGKYRMIYNEFFFNVCLQITSHFYWMLFEKLYLGNCFYPLAFYFNMSIRLFYLLKHFSWPSWINFGNYFFIWPIIIDLIKFCTWWLIF